MKLLPSGGKCELSTCDSQQGTRAAMSTFAGLDVGGKTTAICIVDQAGKTVWQGNPPDQEAGLVDIT
jgi:hypothetical protein